MYQMWPGSGLTLYVAVCDGLFYYFSNADLAKFLFEGYSRLEIL